MAAANRTPAAETRPALGHRCGVPAPHLPASRAAHSPAALHSRRARDVRVYVAEAASDELTGPLKLSPLCYTPAAPRAVEIMWNRMRDANVAPVSCDQMLKSQQEGIPVVDVRPKKAFAEGHIPGSVNIPLYDLIDGWSPYKIGKRFGFLMFATIDGTEMQEDFLNICAKSCDLEKGITLVCEMGWSYPVKPEDFAGKATRSLIAAHELIHNGFKNVKILEKGVDEYVDEDSGRELAKDKV
eukprot:evm.model.scf_1318.4 EVM.evm.TU.scf_1318.4   scf_1318:18213-25116(+)